MEPISYNLRLMVGAGTTHNMTPEQVAQAVQDALTEEFGAGTTTQGLGTWTSPHGEVIREECVIGEVLITLQTPLEVISYRERARRVAGQLAEALNQQAVLFTMQAVETVEFVSTPVLAKVA